MHSTGQRDGRRAVTLIPSDHHELRTLEHIGQIARIYIFDTDSGKRDSNVGEDRITHFVVEARNLAFDVFLGTDVFNGGAVVCGNPVEQVCVHVIADTEGKNPNQFVISGLQIFYYDRAVGHTDSRPSVRHKHNHPRTIRRRYFESGQQCFVYVCSTSRLYGIDKDPGLLPV